MNALARLALIVVLLAVGTLASLAQSRRSHIGYESGATPIGDVRFASYDVYVDSSSAPLAAWQVDIADERHVARLVGVEGGEHPAYAEPPFYDPQALMGGHVVLAAFQTDGALPVGRVRVARLHCEIEGAGEPQFAVRLVAAATIDGNPIVARASIER